MNVRIERDAMGPVQVPRDMLYGAQTARAVENFPISGSGIGRPMIRALGLIKQAAARVNQELDLLAPELADAIAAAAGEVAEGRLDDHFPVDVFQTGSGTSSNMNANEVIANRAIQILGGEVGSKSPVHPNDHVNMGQSSNDVFPTAIHMAALERIESDLLPALEALREALQERSERFSPVIKIGRTHLQDAVPMRLGQEFSAFAAQVDQGIDHLAEVSEGLRELPIGGTAIGTGLNTHAAFGRRMAEKLAELTGTDLAEAGNHFEAQSARDAAVRTSGALKSIAASLMKIADDIRWLGSGPRIGLGELKLPPVQPGSSIMPGKVNPVIAEALIQACAQVIGDDSVITIAGFYSNFQLNSMQPLIARNLLEQITLLANGGAAFTHKLVRNLEPDVDRIETGVEQSLAMATALTPHIGYDRAAEIAKKAAAEGATVRQIARESGLFSDEELNRILDPATQTGEG